MNTVNKEKKAAYTIDEVAALLEQSREAVRKYVAIGILPAQKDGRKYMITKQDLYNFLKNR